MCFTCCIRQLTISTEKQMPVSTISYELHDRVWSDSLAAAVVYLQDGISNATYSYYNNNACSQQDPSRRLQRGEVIFQSQTSHSRDGSSVDVAEIPTFKERNRVAALITAYMEQHGPVTGMHWQTEHQCQEFISLYRKEETEAIEDWLSDKTVYIFNYGRHLEVHANIIDDNCICVYLISKDVLVKFILEGGIDFLNFRMDFPVQELRPLTSRQNNRLLDTPTNA